MLTVGVDSYVTSDEAGEYIRAHYPSADARAKAWGELSEADQEAFLRRACDSMSHISYRGVTFTAFQPLPFPRYSYPGWAMAYRDLIAPLSYIYPELAEVPEEIKAAQIEEAFELACPSLDTKNSQAANGPVASYSIGHLSETFRQAGEGSVAAVLKSGAAQKLVAPYVGGSYDVL